MSNTETDNIIVNKTKKYKWAPPDVQLINEPIGFDDSSDVSRSNVESLGGRVKLVDQLDGLDLFCYVKCSNDDNAFLKKCRGVAFNGDKLVLSSFPFTPEFSDTDVDSIREMLGENFENCSFYDSYEGALIRVFNFSGKWYTSTHRKLNASNSKWASRQSFGLCFSNALEHEITINQEFKDSLPAGELSVVDKFYSTLDVSKQYMFLVLNNRENRIVCDPQEGSKLYHVGTFVDGVCSLDKNTLLSYPKKHTFSNIDELLDYVRSCDIKKIQGVVAFTSTNKQFKIVNKTYQDMFCIRGNEPSVKFRYLQVRRDNKQTEMLSLLYPEFSPVFLEYENSISSISKNIYKAYVNRFIKKAYTSVSHEEFQVMKACHTWHISNRTDNRISLGKILEILNNQTPTALNHMIRRYHIENSVVN